MLIAGGSKAAARRAARYGLGFISQVASDGLKEFYETECRADGFEPGLMQFPAEGAPTAVFVADMFPTSVHLPEPWIMGYDLYPMETLDFKRSFRREAVERGYLVFFEHDPSTAAGRLHETDGTPAVQQVL